MNVHAVIEGLPRLRTGRAVPCTAALGAMLACQVAVAQHSSGYEAPTYAGSAGGTVITGQDGFYIPVAGSQDGKVYTYAGNALGLPQNPTGREQFVGVTGEQPPPPPATLFFARAQRDVVYGLGVGVWTVSFDIAATYLGVLPSAQNIGSFSTQVFLAPNPSEQTFICLATWTDIATAANWDANYVWFDALGTQLQEIPDPGFAGLLVDHWYRWCTVFDLDTNAIVSCTITDLTTGASTTVFPVGRFMFGGGAGPPDPTGPPTGFRYFAGSSTAGAGGNTLGFDNLDIEPGTALCVGVTQCPWDCAMEQDGMVSTVDLLALLAQWGGPGSCDFDGNGMVSTVDLLKLLAEWGPCPCESFCSSETSCVFDNIVNTSLGNATLSINEECHLVLDNIGSSGLDGVRQFPLPQGTAEMKTGFACPNFNAAPVGAQARILMFGDIGGQPGGLISVVTIEVLSTEGTGQILYEADFSPLGATQHQVQLFLGEQLVADVAGLPSGVLLLDSVCCIAADCKKTSACDSEGTLCTDLPTTMTIPGVGSFVADRLRVASQDSQVDWHFQDQFDNFFKDIGPVEMTFQFVGPG